MTVTMTAKITAPVLAGPLFRLRILKRRLAELIAEFAAAVVVGAASACPADTSAREAATSGEEGRGVACEAAGNATMAAAPIASAAASFVSLMRVMGGNSKKDGTVIETIASLVLSRWPR